jgi:hypothetical protein
MSVAMRKSPVVTQHTYNNDVGDLVFAGQQRGAVVEAHHGARRLGAGCACWRCRLGRRLVGFVVVSPICSVVPVSL